MQGFQPAPSPVAARRLQDRGETGRAVFEFAEGVRTGDCEKRNREPLRPSSQTAVYRVRSLKIAEAVQNGDALRRGDCNQNSESSTGSTMRSYSPIGFPYR